jgi:hypothetical protein
MTIWQFNLLFARPPLLSAARVTQGHANAGNYRVAIDMMVDGASFPVAGLGLVVMLICRRK